MKKNWGLGVGLVLMIGGGCVAEGVEPLDHEFVSEGVERSMGAEAAFGECPWEDYRLDVVDCGDYSLTGTEAEAGEPVCKPAAEGYECMGQVTACDCTHGPERQTCDDDSQTDGILSPQGSGVPECASYDTRYTPDSAQSVVGTGLTIGAAEADYWEKASQTCDLACVTGSGGTISDIEGEGPQDSIVCCVPDEYDPEGPWPPPPAGDPDPAEPIPDSGTP